MTRFWANGTPITVHGNLEAFVWNKQQHRIERVAKKWRVDEGWWTERQWREYAKVVTETGLLAVIFQDLITKQWYLQRLYD